MQRGGVRYLPLLEMIFVFGDADVEAGAGDDPAFVHRVLIIVPQRDELVVAIEVGEFEAGSDTPLAVADPVEGAGEQSVTFLPDDPLVQVSQGAHKDFFVVVRFAAGAAGHSPNSLRVTHQTSLGLASISTVSVKV